MGQLETVEPSFYSMTFGTLGSTRSNSIKMLEAMQEDYAVPITAHLTASGHSKRHLLELATHLYSMGIERIVALRGDAAPVNGEINNVVELIGSLKSIADFDISVAAYPEVHPKAVNPSADLLHLKQKLNAGANRAISQYFFDADVFLRFRDKAYKAGINQPIVPGILPVHDFDKVVSFSHRCGTQVPESLIQLYEYAPKDKDIQQEIGVEHATRLWNTPHGCAARFYLKGWMLYIFIL